MSDFKEKVRVYLEKVPGDSIQTALAACSDYVNKVFEHETCVQSKVLCTDRDSRDNWQAQVSMLDSVRHDAHEKLMRAIRAANSRAVSTGLEPLFPVADDAVRTEFGDVAFMAVESYFRNRQ